MVPIPAPFFSSLVDGRGALSLRAHRARRLCAPCAGRCVACSRLCGVRCEIAPKCCSRPFCEPCSQLGIYMVLWEPGCTKLTQNLMVLECASALIMRMNSPSAHSSTTRRYVSVSCSQVPTKPLANADDVGACTAWNHTCALLRRPRRRKGGRSLRAHRVRRLCAPCAGRCVACRDCVVCAVKSHQNAVRGHFVKPVRGWAFTWFCGNLAHETDTYFPWFECASASLCA